MWHRLDALCCLPVSSFIQNPENQRNFATKSWTQRGQRRETVEKMETNGSSVASSKFSIQFRFSSGPALLYFKTNKGDRSPLLHHVQKSTSSALGTLQYYCLYDDRFLKSFTHQRARKHKDGCVVHWCNEDRVQEAHSHTVVFYLVQMWSFSIKVRFRVNKIQIKYWEPVFSPYLSVRRRLFHLLP